MVKDLPADARGRRDMSSTPGLRRSLVLEMAVSLPGQVHGERNLGGYSPWIHRE